MSYIFILGASDPEMATIERLCRSYDFEVTYALSNGRRVHAGNAYVADPINFKKYQDLIPVWVECRSNNFNLHDVIVDHHQQGDPGFGFPPEQYWLGSSIGQICKLIGHPQTNELSIVAAADHCLSHAYKGKCPGVNPDDLRKWRAKTRSDFQRIPLETIEQEIETALSVLHNQPTLEINNEHFIDARGIKLKEFAEASAILGKSVIYEIYDSKSRRMKVGVLGGSTKQIKTWMDWAASFLINCYGDPDRGYAGGYKP